MADLIDRQAAIDEILSLTIFDTVRSLYEATVADKHDDYKQGIMDAIDVIVALTSVQPERKTGRWTPIPTLFRTLGICSVCHNVAGIEYEYCPWCGAKMEVVNDER